MMASILSLHPHDVVLNTLSSIMASLPRPHCGLYSPHAGLAICMVTFLFFCFLALLLRHQDCYIPPQSWSSTRVSSKQSIFFRFEPKQTKTQSVSVVFRFVSQSQQIFFRFVRCFGPVSKQPKQTEFSGNKPKKSHKNLGVLKTVDFFLGLNRKKPKLNLFWLFFGLLFRETPKNFSVGFLFVSVVSKHRKSLFRY